MGAIADVRRHELKPGVRVTVYARPKKHGVYFVVKDRASGWMFTASDTVLLSKPAFGLSQGRLPVTHGSFMLTALPAKMALLIKSKGSLLDPNDGFRDISGRSPFGLGHALFIEGRVFGLESKYDSLVSDWVRKLEVIPGRPAVGQSAA